jgi:hypothetical protein
MYCPSILFMYITATAMAELAIKAAVRWPQEPATPTRSEFETGIQIHIPVEILP